MFSYPEGGRLRPDRYWRASCTSESVVCTGCREKSIRRTTVSAEGRRREADWKRGLSAVSQWSESNACRPKTEPAEHLHTRISMPRTHEKIIDCLRTRPLPLFASINASNRPIETVHARQPSPFVTAKHSRVRCTVFFSPLPPSL